MNLDKIFNDNESSDKWWEEDKSKQG